jgi:predicted TIM-barrel fold metal-dependent hydrolase
MAPSVSQLRQAYRAVRDSLPWLDASAYPSERPAFPQFAKPLATPFVRAMTASAAIAGRVGQLRREGALQLARYSSAESGPLENMEPLLTELAAQRVPLVVYHTDVPLPKVAELAGEHPRLSVILESGPRKILYFFSQVQELLSTWPNVLLSTYNLCNWLGLERLAGAGAGERLLFGTHAPVYGADVSMGPIVMSRMPWAVKCGIAGNNLRRLLGMAEEHPPEAPWAPPPPFIIDTHGHCMRPGTGQHFNFPMPDEDADFGVANWTEFLDTIAVETVCLSPGESLVDARRAPLEGCGHLVTAAPGRFRYLVVFDPRIGADHARAVGESLKDPLCVGIKIHPMMHRVPADDDSYAEAYRLSRAAGKPILAHSWEISSYNPAQHLAHPDRFRRYLQEFPQARLVLGHAGGRPSAFDAVKAVCQEYPAVMVDIAGDYFDSGVVDALVSALGADRVLFASDVDWIDPRSNLGPVLASDLRDEDTLKVLRTNALRAFAGPAL